MARSFAQGFAALQFKISFPRFARRNLISEHKIVLPELPQLLLKWSTLDISKSFGSRADPETQMVLQQYFMALLRAIRLIDRSRSGVVGPKRVT
jgi:hypothetical protein